MIKVGRIEWDSARKRYSTPDFENYHVCIPLTEKIYKYLKYLLKNQEPDYFSLSPYSLTIETTDKTNGNTIYPLFENYYQFSKVYPVLQGKDNYSGWCCNFDSPALEDGQLTPSFYQWQSLGWNYPLPVRYPVGYNNRSKCLCSVDSEGNFLNYIEARKKIYVSQYIKEVVKMPQFQDLKQILKEGKNILILDVDGPCEASLDYYKQKYKTGNFIKDKKMKITLKNLKIMLEDEKHPFGHGYCLAMALLM